MVVLMSSSKCISDLMNRDLTIDTECKNEIAKDCQTSLFQINGKREKEKIEKKRCYIG
jgi:hypothetical protein